MAPAGRLSPSRLATRAVDTIGTRRERQANARLRATLGLIPTVRRSRRIVFLCYGNINRSALAERHLETLVGEQIVVESCGLHDVEGRAADPNMVDLAARHALTLDPWSSRRATPELMTGADLVLAMESWHLTQLHRRLPATRGRAFLLGATTDDPAVPLEIADPYGGAPEDYELAFEQVTTATAHLAEVLLGSPSDD
jgi:protein-tyrosine phosphatase